MNLKYNSINDIERGFEDLDFNLKINSDNQIIISQSNYRDLEKIYWNYYTSEGKVIPVIDTGNWIIDIATNGINLNSRSSGLIDGIAIENSHKYLIWGFLDQNLQFIGYGLSRWEKSSYTAVSSGTKGSEATYTITNAYQFTIGARVRVSSTSSDWNYGTVSEITNSTTLKIIMDNESGYGTNCTTATGSIWQFNKHRPYIIGTNSQELYSDYYRLLGWCELGLDDSGTGGVDNTQNIMIIRRWKRKRFFQIPIQSLYNGTTAATGANANINTGKYISPFTTSITGRARIACDNADNGYFIIIDIANQSQLIGGVLQNNYSATTQYQDNFYETRIDPYYNIRVERTNIANTPTYTVWVSGYYEED